MCKQFSSMMTADIQVVISCIKDPKCTYLREYESRQEVTTTEPKDKMPSGKEILRCLPPDQKYPDKVKSRNISMFDHITNAYSEVALAATDILSLAKIADMVTLDMVLKAATRPIVQINIPVKYLNSTVDAVSRTGTEQ